MVVLACSAIMPGGLCAEAEGGQMTSNRRGLSLYGVVLATVGALVVVFGVVNVLSQPGAIGSSGSSFLLVVAAGVVVGVLSKLIGVFGSERTRRARWRLSFWRACLAISPAVSRRPRRLFSSH